MSSAKSFRLFTITNGSCVSLGMLLVLSFVLSLCEFSLDLFLVRRLDELLLGFQSNSGFDEDESKVGFKVSLRPGFWCWKWAKVLSILN